ncbi:MAG: hypothetical protein GF372_00150 [Candidatus Marinimicrobia bacterium]|nr:hypothetical protein [Candidatus Neomarinimicrobiota bacterium]
MIKGSIMVETQDIWKKFDESELTHNSEHHLLAIDHLIDTYGYARAVDISNYLNLSRASVSITLGKLEEKGYVETDPNKFYHLCDQGKAIVNTLIRNRHILIDFFSQVIGLSEQQAEIEACKIEHLVSGKTAQYLEHFRQLYLSDATEAKAFSTFVQNQLTNDNKEL